MRAEAQATGTEASTYFLSGYERFLPSEKYRRQLAELLKA